MAEERGRFAACVHGLRRSKQSRIGCFMRTKPPFDAPSMAQKGFGGRPVRQFLGMGGLLRTPKSNHNGSKSPSPLCHSLSLAALFRALSKNAGRREMKKSVR